MDYEKKYNEALEDMRVVYPNLKGEAKLAIEHAFPELAESEDERRIDAICGLLENTSAIHPNYSHRKLIIWLKSLRSKPHWKLSEEQMEALSWAINYLTDIEQECASTLALLKFNLKELM